MKKNILRDDAYWMRKALLLAEKGASFTSPNPMVGCVIVKNGRLVGQGWHKKCGGPHAEIEALSSLKSPSDAKGATLYVTLEPCSTTGRTPPCTRSIISSGVKRVVSGCADPNPRHAGNGFRILEEVGIEVKSCVLENECRLLNEAFFKWITTGRPFVLLKLAETLDGKIATSSGSSKWITGEKARKFVMSLRMKADLVMAGRNTFTADNPSFTVRTPGGKIVRTPRRMILTHHKENLVLPGADWETADPDVEGWDNLLARLGSEGVTSVLLEGGGEAAASALAAKAVDKVAFFIAPKILGGRSSRPSVGGEDPASIDESTALRDVKVKRIGSDLLVTAYPDYSDEKGKKK